MIQNLATQDQVNKNTSDISELNDTISKTVMSNVDSVEFYNNNNGKYQLYMYDNAQKNEGIYFGVEYSGGSWYLTVGAKTASTSWSQKAYIKLTNG